MGAVSGSCSRAALINFFAPCTVALIYMIVLMYMLNDVMKDLRG